ncbi:class I SAM-dependent methyltransferase [Crenalkalicoccus roseus]|uniref:class I SAM-dependent methyltransferase n=1 Tax=Crenalkalicoccus roseus TaxID=1485588 RepID=UPI0010811157|nr:class I SAM-dependent methyltransferase [Crenalkalicoccus roseus]
MPRFTESWFDGHIPGWEHLFFRELGWDPAAPRRIVEIGCFEGRATIWMLENLLRHPDSRIHCIDSFAGGAEHHTRQVERLHERFRANIEESGHAAKVEVLHGNSADGLLRLIARGDVAPAMIYVDGSHEAPDVLSDLVLSFRLAPPGGVILCDDYLWSREAEGSTDLLHCPKLAIDAFTNIYRRRIEFLGARLGGQVAFRKRAA